MRKLFLAYVLLAACHPSSKSVSRKENDANTAKGAYYPYPSVYKNMGTVVTDTTSKKP